jgi:hypothetical protein
MKKILFVFVLVQITITYHLSAQIKYLESMKKELEDFPIKSAFCKKVNQSPLIDGKLDDDVWRNAPELNGFDVLNGNTKAVNQTKVFAVHDSRFFYIGFECSEPEMEKIRAQTFRYDDRDLLFDDRLEILLDVEHNHKNIIRFAVNSNGFTYDTKLERPVQYSVSYIRGDDRWNTEWRAKTQKYEDRWTGEVAIAIDRIYNKKLVPGTTWGFNIVRDRHSEMTYGPRGMKLSGTREISLWKQVWGYVKGEISDSYIEPNQYGDLIFDQDQIQVTNLSFNEAYANYNGSIWHKPQFFGDNPIQITLQNNSKSDIPIEVILNTTSFDGTNISVTKQTLSKPAGKSLFSSIIPIRSEERQTFTIILLNKNTDKLLYHTSYDTRVPPFVEFDLASVYKTYKEGQEHIKVCPVVIPGALKDVKLKIELWKGNTLVAKDELNTFKEYSFQSCFENLNLSDLAQGNYVIKSYLLNEKHETIGKSNQPFTLNRPREWKELMVHDTIYSFGGREGKAIVVNFSSGEQFVFWEHASYIPWWEIQNMAVTYEFMECWGYTNQGCSEPMQDKENRYSKPEIIENNPARVIILWRYALSDPNYRIIFNEWVHEYYYLYPDGSGVREIQFWANSNIAHEILQPQYIFPNGVIPEQMFEDTVCMVFNLNGEKAINLLGKPILIQPESTKTWNEEIMRIYLKARKHPYLVWSKRKDIIPNSENNNLVVGDVRHSMGGHWPMQPLNVDVYSVVGTNKPYHSWLGSIHVLPTADKQPNTWIHLIGITDKANSELITIGKNWLYPPKVTLKSKGYHYERYDVKQKAYIIKNENVKEPTLLNFSFSDSENNIINPVLIISNMNNNLTSIKVGGKNIGTDNFKSGMESHGMSNNLVIWINEEISPGDPISLQFERIHHN